MKKGLIRKGLVFSIIVLFIGVGIQPVFANDISISNMDNNPPGVPTVTGPGGGKPGIEYTYTFNAEDPDGDDIRFHIDWDDGYSDTTLYVPSGTDADASHTWENEGTYTGTVYAEDIHGLIGPEVTWIIGPWSYDDIEIITFIKDSICWTYTDYSPPGLFDFYIGSIEMFSVYPDDIYIHGVKKFNGNLSDILFSDYIDYINASLFIGTVRPWYPFDSDLVNGIVLGNIEWS